MSITSRTAPYDLQQAREQALAMGVNIYVIGAANVGKSTLINHLLQDVSVLKKGKASQKNKLFGQGLTVRYSG